MYQLYYTKSGAAWSSKELIWKSDMAIDPAKYGIYDMQCNLEVNKAGELKFVMTKSGSSYNLFSKERSVLTLLMDDSTLIFRGVVKTIETDLFFQRTITAQSDIIYLSDSVFEPHGSDIEEKPSERFKRILDHHNLEMQGDPEKQIRPGNFTFTDGADDVEKYTKNGGYKDTTSQLQNDFKDFYGFYNIRYNEDFSQKWLDYTETTGKSTSQDIKFAVNIEDYQFKDTVDDLFTILIPCGSDNLVLSGQNEKRTVDIRMPDQSKRTINLYIVDKYIKIVEGIEAYGYIYQAESFTVDSNNIGRSGSNGRVGSGASAQGGYEYLLADSTTVTNPAAQDLWYLSGSTFVKATETTPVPGREYCTRQRANKYKVTSPASGANPMALGWSEYSNGTFVPSNDTSVVEGKTYYSRTPPSASDGYTYTKYFVNSDTNPADEKLYYQNPDGTYTRATETSPVSGRQYWKRSGGSGGGGDDDEPHYRVRSVSSSDNPSALGLYERRAFTIATFQRTTDTEPKYGKTYYERY